MALTMTSGWPWRGLSVLLTLSLWFGVMSPAMAGTVDCTTREDPQFKRLVTTCKMAARRSRGMTSRSNAGAQR